MKLNALKCKCKFALPELCLEDDNFRRLTELGVFPNQVYKVLAKNITGSMVISNDMVTVAVDSKIASSLNIVEVK